MNAPLGNPEANAQTMMMSAEVVDGADQKHAMGQGFGLASECPTASNQASQALTEGGIEPLDERGIDLPSLLTAFDELLDQLSTALSDTALKVLSSIVCKWQFFIEGNAPRNE
jgi:hypothetical protein